MLGKIQFITDSIWDEAGAWSDYVQTMRFALRRDQGEHDLSMMSLPGLCCSAAGGHPDQADPVSAAWYLFYRAASIMDSVEDCDEPEYWWKEGGPGVAISAATGIYFTACQTLNRLDTLLDDRVAASEIRSKMLNRFITMGSGQHFDLTHAHFSLEDYWKVAAAKSGAFFEMACWAGGRISTSDHTILDALQYFGLQVGLAVQILDDLKEFTDLEQQLYQKKPASLRRSLPIVYVMDVASDEVRARLTRGIDEGYSQLETINEIIRIIEQNGGVFYVETELEKLRFLAEKALDNADISLISRRALLKFLNKLHSGD